MIDFLYSFKLLFPYIEWFILDDYLNLMHKNNNNFFRYTKKTTAEMVAVNIKRDSINDILILVLLLTHSKKK